MNKRIASFVIASLLFWALCGFVAAQITVRGLPVATTAADADLLLIAKSPFGTGSTRNITFGNFKSSLFNSPALVTPSLTLGSDASGDMYYRNASGILTRIPVAGHSLSDVLTLGASSVPGWAAPTGGGGGTGQPAGSGSELQARLNGTTFLALTGSSISGANLTLAGNLTFSPGSVIGFKDKGGQVFNVRSYGAVGDGTTDDAVAINSAITAATATKGIVYLPPGTYAVGAEFVLPSGVTLRGAGSETTVLKALLGFANGGQMVFLNNVDYAVVEQLGFTTVATAGTHAAVKLIGSEHCTVRDIHVGTNFQWTVFIGNTADGSHYTLVDHIVGEGTVNFEQIAVIDSNYVTIQNSRLKATAAGTNIIELFLSTPGTLIGTRIVGNTFEGSAGIAAAIAIGGDTQTTIANNVITNAPTGILADTNAGVASNGASITGNLIRGATGAIVLAAGTSRITVSGNTIETSSGSAITADGVQHTITGNTITGSGISGIGVQGNRCVVSGNTVLNSNNYGITIDGDNNSVVANIATDNRTPKISPAGLSFGSGASDNVFGANDISGNLSDEVQDSGTRNGLRARTVSGGTAADSDLFLQGTTNASPSAANIFMVPGNAYANVIIGLASEIGSAARLQIVGRGSSPLAEMADASGNTKFRIDLAAFNTFALPSTSGVTTNNTPPTNWFSSYWTGSANAFERISFANIRLSAGAGGYEGQWTNEVGALLVGLNASGLRAPSIRGVAVTFANLPASPIEGMLVPVTDSSTATWGATITGGGSNHVLGYWNGSAWTVAAK